MILILWIDHNINVYVIYTAHKNDNITIIIYCLPKADSR